MEIRGEDVVPESWRPHPKAVREDVVIVADGQSRRSSNSVVLVVIVRRIVLGYRDLGGELRRVNDGVVFAFSQGRTCASQTLASAPNRLQLKF